MLVGTCTGDNPHSLVAVAIAKVVTVCVHYSDSGYMHTLETVYLKIRKFS